VSNQHSADSGAGSKAPPGTAGGSPLPVQQPTGAPRDPGLSAQRPFRFRCRRSGRCCTVGEGHVYLAPGEEVVLAATLGLDPSVFRARFLRLVTDPQTGALRPALREAEHLPAGNGRCALLEGHNHCSVYASRPLHCQRFPYWDSILAGGEGFERALETCPGIEPEPRPEDRQAAFAALKELYGDLERKIAASGSVCLARGVCCRFEQAGHELFATSLETDYAASIKPEAPAPEAPGRCPYHQAGRCTNREGRPLGCRTYFCDPQTEPAMQALHESLLIEIRRLAQQYGFAPSYTRFPEALEWRGVGRAAAESLPHSPGLDSPSPSPES
jgi:Fe-S-cluster containining protein